MMFRLVQEYLGDEELQRIAGISPGLSTSQAEIQGAYDFAVKFDVRELDSDFVVGKMKAIIDLLPIDTAGTVDRAKLMSIAVSMVDAADRQGVVALFQCVACCLGQFLDFVIGVLKKSDQVAGRFLGGVGLQCLLHFRTTTA